MEDCPIRRAIEEAWVVNYFKSKKSGALALRSIMCMATRVKKESD
jgi:predicted acetyltransferase